MAIKTKDPVCGQDVTGKATACSSFEDKQYCFCSEECKEKFDRDPSAFSGKK